MLFIIKVWFNSQFTFFYGAFISLWRKLAQFWLDYFCFFKFLFLCSQFIWLNWFRSQKRAGSWILMTFRWFSERQIIKFVRIWYGVWVLQYKCICINHNKWILRLITLLTSTIYIIILLIFTRTATTPLHWFRQSQIVHSRLRWTFLFFMEYIK